VAAKIGMAFGVLLAILFLVVFAACWWKRRQNILRAKRLAAGKKCKQLSNEKSTMYIGLCCDGSITFALLIAAREAPYAKSRTQFTRDVQMAKHQRTHENARSSNSEGSPHLLS
jgi:hypothetical protein